MRQSLRISLALLISLVVFAAFTALSFTGLFSRLQVTFFQPRVQREREKSLAAAAELIERYHRLNLERFIEPLKQPYILSAFSRIGQESREDIFNRGNYFGKLLDEYPSLQGVRFLSADGKIHFSTFPGDVKTRAKDQIGYFPYTEAEKGEKALPAGALLAPQGGPPQLLIDGQADRFIYSYPVADPRGGTAVIYFSKNGLAETLLRDPRLEFRELVLIDRLGVVLNVPESEKGLLAPVVVKAWDRRTSDNLSSETVILSAEGGAQAKQLLLSQPAGRFGLVGWLVPYSSFQLQPLMKAVILASVLLTVFLLVFLIFNLRQDPLLVLSQRVKRFQLQILQEFIEGRKEVDWRRWRDELAGGRPELRSRIKKGIGRLPAGKEAEIDGLIDRSWDEIIRIIEARIGQQARERMDIGVVEQLIQKALDRGRITVEAAPATAAPTLPAVTPAPGRAPLPPRRESLQVEEIGVEEVTEAEEARAPSAGAEQAQPQEAVEELEEVEAAEEVEAVGQAEAGELPEAEEVGEEAEAVEALPVAEVEEAGPAEGAAPRAPAALAAAQPEAVTEAAEALEELEPMRELESLPLEPQEQLEELPQAEPPPPPQPAGPSAPAPAEKVPRELEELEAEAEAQAPPAVSPGPEGRPAAATQAEEIEEEIEPEELIGLEESPGAPAEPPEVKQKMEIEAAPMLALPDLVGKGLIRTFSLSEVEALVAEARASVVMQNGVYQVKEELRVGAPSPREKRGGKGLKALAEEVLSTGGEAPPAGDVSGISELLDNEVGLDLATELEGLRAKAQEARFPDRQRVKKIQFYGEGLDYDQFLNQFDNGSSDTGVLKSLLEISRKLKAVSAAILMKVGQSFCSVLRVGLMDKPEAIRFTAGEPFYERFLKERQTVLILERPAQIPALADKFHAEDLRYMQGALFLPAVYKRAPAFLFLGLPTKRGRSLKEIIAQLDIY